MDVNGTSTTPSINGTTSYRWGNGGTPPTEITIEVLVNYQQQQMLNYYYPMMKVLKFKWVIKW